MFYWFKEGLKNGIEKELVSIRSNGDSMFDGCRINVPM
jgi:hypothetical protein